MFLCPIFNLLLEYLSINECFQTSFRVISESLLNSFTSSPYSTYGCLHPETTNRVYRRLTVRQLDYLKFLRQQNVVIYGEILLILTRVIVGPVNGDEITPTKLEEEPPRRVRRRSKKGRRPRYIYIYKKYSFKHLLLYPTSLDDFKPLMHNLYKVVTLLKKKGKQFSCLNISVRMTILSKYASIKGLNYLSNFLNLFQFIWFMLASSRFIIVKTTQPAKSLKINTGGGSFC